MVAISGADGGSIERSSPPPWGVPSTAAAAANPDLIVVGVADIGASDVPVLRPLVSPKLDLVVKLAFSVAVTSGLTPFAAAVVAAASIPLDVVGWNAVSCSFLLPSVANSCVDTTITSTCHLRPN